jgi:hypothetical protein
MAVLVRLIWLQEELNAIREGMKEKNFSESLYEPSLAQVQNAFAPLALGMKWADNGRVHLKAEVLSALAFCAEILPDEEAAVSEDDLAAIRSAAAELEVLLEVTTLPAQLRAIIKHHIDLIHAALDKYPIAGVAALRDAAWTAAGELMQAQSDPGMGGTDFSSQTEVKQLHGLWDKVNSTVEAAVKTESIYQLGTTAYALAQKLLGAA